MVNTDWSVLNGLQQKLLRETILSAYTDPLEFDMFLAAQLNKPPLANIAAGGTFEQRIFSLIAKAKAEGWTKSLIEALQEDRPNNPLVRNFPDAVRMAGTVSPRKPTAGPQAPPALTLERIVQNGGFDDIRMFSQKLADIGEAVCRIESPAGTARGTGILVSPELVITNYHVVKEQITAAANVPEIICRFDYARDVAGVAEGVPVSLSSDGKWLLADSPYDEKADVTGAGVARPNCLDFAILRLSSPVATQRKPLMLRSDAVSVEKTLPVFIVQHPKGTPMALAIGASLGLNENGSRLRYDADTLSGSSGSPVFNQHLDLMALHHAGDPEAVTRATYNQGIPMAKIALALAALESDLAGKGISKFWQ